MFFPDSSIRTRVTFEKGIYLLGGQSILFPTETLDKKEKLEDVCGYLNHWADLIIARHRDMEVLKELARCADIPVINAMTDRNHPCEIISDLSETISFEDILKEEGFRMEELEKLADSVVID